MKLKSDGCYHTNEKKKLRLTINPLKHWESGRQINDVTSYSVCSSCDGCIGRLAYKSPRLKSISPLLKSIRWHMQSRFAKQKQIEDFGGKWRKEPSNNGKQVTKGNNLTFARCQSSLDLKLL